MRGLLLGIVVFSAVTAIIFSVVGYRRAVEKEKLDKFLASLPPPHSNRKHLRVVRPRPDKK